MDIEILKNLLSDHKTGHTEFQCDNFIVGKSGTKYGQYKQALAELYKRWRGLRELSCDLEKSQIECEREAFKAENEENEFDRRIAAVEHKRKVMQLEEANRTLESTNREFLRFYQHAASLKQELEKDGKLTDEKKQKLEEEQWEFHLKCKAAIDFAATGRVSGGVYEALIACPKPIRGSLLFSLQSPNELIAWFENIDDTNMNLVEVENVNILDMDISKINIEI